MKALIWLLLGGMILVSSSCGECDDCGPIKTYSYFIKNDLDKNLFFYYYDYLIKDSVDYESFSIEQNKLRGFIILKPLILLEAAIYP